MKQIIGAKIVTPKGVLENKVLVFGEKFSQIADAPLPNCETIDRSGKYILPGFIDVHLHGYDGADVSDGTDEALRTISEGILKNGVTAYLPTTMTISYEGIEKAFDCARRARDAQKTYKKVFLSQADIIGVHAEGPFISMGKKGAQNGDYIKAPDADFILKHKDIISMITIAPETDDNFKVIKKVAAESDIVLSMGHTEADYETGVKAIEAGMTHATHFFNAMPSMSHRAPGCTTAALFSNKVSCELICDGIHVNKAWFEPMYRIKGRKLNLITDTLRACGLPDGTYESGGQMFELKGKECHIAGTNTIAGSVLKLNEAVKNLRDCGVPFHEAVNCASLYPAETLGISDVRGSIAPDLLADFSVCDYDMNVYEVYKRGEVTIV